MATKAVVPKRDVELEQKALSWPEKARALAVVDQRSYVIAADALRGIKDLRAELDTTFDPIIVKARESLNTARETKAKLERPLADAEKILKDNRIAWSQAQERIRLERQQQADREAEERAAKQRAQELADARRQGASRAELKAVAAQPVMVVPVTVESTVEKVAGISMQDHWGAEVNTSMTENAALLSLASAVVHGKVPICALLPNMTYLNQQARSLKTLFDVPGYHAVNHPTEAVRRG
jgi:hypothetical protein